MPLWIGIGAIVSTSLFGMIETINHDGIHNCV